MIRPDRREAIWYETNSLIGTEIDIYPHYFHLLISRIQMLEDGIKRPICITCFNFDNLIITKNKYTCKKNHNIVLETGVKSINRVIDIILDWLIEPSKYRLSLTELEDYLYEADNDDFFETLKGKVTKAEVKRELFRIKLIAQKRLVDYGENIRFGASMRTPSIQM